MTPCLLPLALLLALAACLTPPPRQPVPELQRDLDYLQVRAERASRVEAAAERVRRATDRAALLRRGPERSRAGRTLVAAHVELREALDAADGQVCR